MVGPPGPLLSRFDNGSGVRLRHVLPSSSVCCMAETVRLSLRIDPEIRQFVDEYAARTHRTLRAAVELLLLDGLEMARQRAETRNHPEDV